MVNDYHLKVCILINVDDLRITGKYLVLQKTSISESVGTLIFIEDLIFRLSLFTS